MGGECSQFEVFEVSSYAGDFSEGQIVFEVELVEDVDSEKVGISQKR